MSKASLLRIRHTLNSLDRYNLTKTDRVCIEYCLKVVYSIKTMMDMPNRIFKKLIDSAEEVRE